LRSDSNSSSSLSRTGEEAEVGKSMTTFEEDERRTVGRRSVESIGGEDISLPIR
jgi:hypothetical protein